MSVWSVDMLITLVGAAVLALVLVLVLLGGPIGPVWRKRIEVGGVLLLFPAVTALWLYRAWEAFGEDRMWTALGFGLVAAVFLWLGVTALRRRSLTPFAKSDR